MSIKTLAGISAAAILSILAGKAYGELASDLKATKSNGCETANNVSTILGGSNICGGFASFVQVYNRGEANYAATLGANGSSYGNGALFATHNGDWSSLVAVKLSATENTIIWSTGRYYGGATGLALIQKDSSTVALVKWTTGGFAEIASASVTAGKYHTILVTHKYTAAVEETAAQSVYAIYVDGTATEGTTASVAAYTDLDDSGFQYGSVHGAVPTGLNNTAGILIDEAGVWTSKCLTETEAATVAAEFVYNDVTIHAINISADTNWSAVAPASIGENDVIEIRSNSKTLTFDAAETVIPCKVVFVSGLTRVVNPGNVSMTGEVVVNQGAELWIECEGVAANEEVPTIADDITVYGTIRPHNLSTTAGGDATITTDETTKVHFAQNMTLAGGELHVEDGHVVFTGTINVAEGTTAKYTPKWRKASIIKTLNVPETSTFKMSPNLSSDGAGSLIKIAGGTIDGRIELSGNNKATKLQASDALAGKTLYLTSGGKIDLSSQTVGFEKIVVEGGTTAAPNEITGNGNNGTVEIAANAVVKDIHTGGNKIYTYSGAGSASSTLIVTGSTDWGIADGASLSNLKLSVQDASHIFYVERGIGNDVALEVGAGARVSIADPKTFATVSGTGTIQVSRWPKDDNSVTLTGASTFEGTITTPVKLANGSSLTLTNGGTISADPTTDVAKKRVKKTVTTEGEGEEAVTTTAYTLVDLVTLKIPVIEHTIAQYRYSATDEWTSVTTTEGEYNTVVVDKSVCFFFQYISEDETKWTVSGDQSGYKYSSGLSQDTTYNAPKTGITVSAATVTITIPDAPANMTVSVDGADLAQDGTITVAPGTEFTVTYTPDEGYCGEEIVIECTAAADMTIEGAPTEDAEYGVASIDGVLYPSVQAAINAAQEGDAIVLVDAEAEIPEGYYVLDDIVLKIPAKPIATVTNITGTEEAPSDLDSAYKFVANEPDKAVSDYYGDWLADFEVSFDDEIDAGSIELRGFYEGAYGDNWVGFPLGEEGETIAKDEIISLMSYVPSDFDVTYDVISSMVKTFYCGVRNNSTDNIGTKMTVKLVLSRVDEDTQEVVETITISTTEYTLVAPKATDLPGAEEVPANEKTAYNEWAAANGVTESTTTDAKVLATAYAMGVTIGEHSSIEEAAKQAVEDEVPAIDMAELVSGDLEAAVATIQDKYPNATVSLKEVTTTIAGEGATNTHLYKLVIELK